MNQKRNCMNCDNRPKCCEISPKNVGCINGKSKWTPIKLS